MEHETISLASENGHNIPITTKVVTKRVIPAPIEEYDPNAQSPAHEEWTTSKKKVNHKTKQVETRVQRQIILEDGKVIADSGPQVTTRTTEDNKTEESENTEHKTSGDPPTDSCLMSPKVVSEKTETHQTTKETKEENMQLHDESYRELTGTEYHQQALMSKEDTSMSIIGTDGKPNFPGKLTHYSSKSQKVTDKDEIKEISELKDGELTMETTRTHHHEETNDDEIPEDEVDEAGLPEISTETARKIEYYNTDDFDSLSAKIRKEKEKNIKREVLTDRKDPLTRRKLDFYQEEGIRNNETSRWLDDHFGSDGSDIAEPTKPKSSGNIINIHMAPTRKPNTTDEHEHADDTVIRPSTAGPAHASERMMEKPSYQFASNTSSKQKDFLSSLSATQNTRATHFASDRVSDKYNRVHTDIYQTPSQKSTRPPASNRSTLNIPIKTFNTSDKKSVPKRTFYLGENGTYNATLGKPLNESTPLHKNSFAWKSSPSITEDLARMLSEETKIKRHESFQNDNRTFTNRNVQRSQSQKGPARKIPIRKEEYLVTSPSDTTNFGGYVSQTLPRDSKYHAKNKELGRSLFQSSFGNNYLGNSFDNSRVIQVELLDEKYRGSSPSFFHRPDVRESQTLPRNSSSASPYIESSDNKNHHTSSFKSQRNFYYGDNSDNKSYQNSLRKSTSESSNHYYDGIKTSDSFTFTPNPRSSKFQPSPRSELLNSRHYANFEDTSRHFNTEQDRSLGDTFIKSTFSHGLSSNLYENTEPKNSGLIRVHSTSENNAKNNQSSRNYNQTEGTHQKLHSNGHYSSVNEARRNQFIKGLITSSDQACDYSHKRSNVEDQRQSSLHVNYDSNLVHSSRSKTPHDIRPNITPSSVEQTGFQPAQHKGLLKTASFSKQHPDNRRGLQTTSGGPIDMVNTPAFTPLSCHLQIKNMSNLNAKSSSKHEDKSHSAYQNKPTSKTGPIMVEIRDWDSR